MTLLNSNSLNVILTTCVNILNVCIIGEPIASVFVSINATTEITYSLGLRFLNVGVDGLELVNVSSNNGLIDNSIVPIISFSGIDLRSNTLTINNVDNENWVASMFNEKWSSPSSSTVLVTTPNSVKSLIVSLTASVFGVNTYLNAYLKVSVVVLVVSFDSSINTER